MIKSGPTMDRGGKNVLLLAALLLAAALALGQDGARLRLQAAVHFLADDLLEGRGTPSRGLDIAALYLANQLRAEGWRPALGDSYFQFYPVREFSPRDAQYQVSINGTALPTEEYALMPFGLDPVRTPLRLPLVFVGHGIAAPERGIDDAAGVDLKGKAAVALLGAPWTLDPSTPFGYDRAVGKSISATDRGASLLIYVSSELESQGPPPSLEAAFVREMKQVPLAYLPDFNKPTMGLGPVLFLTPAVFDRLLASKTGTSYAQWQSRLTSGGFRAQILDSVVELSIQVEPHRGWARNVLATLPGTDPDLKDEWVVLTAHYDHLGSHPLPEGQDGIWNGADDNASGTAAVIEIARRLAQGPPPRRSVLVFLTSGEDRGLLGSAYYSAHPVVPFDRVAVNINVDMIGRSTGSVQAIAPGSAELFNQAAELGEKHAISVKPDQQPSWRILYLIDSYHFARFEVPIIEFFTGIHPDYHQPTDEAERIRYSEMARIVDLVADLTHYFVEGGPRPPFQRPPWFQTTE